MPTRSPFLSDDIKSLAIAERVLALHNLNPKRRPFHRTAHKYPYKRTITHEPSTITYTYEDGSSISTIGAGRNYTIKINLP